MSRKIYRVCLIILLVAVIAGGIWYYTTHFGSAKAEDGTFVQNLIHCYKMRWV